MDDTWIFLDIREPVFLILSLPPFLEPMKDVSGSRILTLMKFVMKKFLFSSKTAYQTIMFFWNKISFYAKEPYNLPLKPHVVIRDFPQEACWVWNVLMTIILLNRAPWRRRWWLRLLWWSVGVRSRGLHRLPVAEMESLCIFYFPLFPDCNKFICMPYGRLWYL